MSYPESAPFVAGICKIFGALSIVAGIIVGVGIYHNTLELTPLCIIPIVSGISGGIFFLALGCIISLLEAVYDGMEKMYLQQSNAHAEVKTSLLQIAATPLAGADIPARNQVEF